MSTTYRPYLPQQELLLPPSVEDWLPESHLAYFISDAIDELDLQAFHAAYAGDGRRRQPYHPGMMIKVLVYGYAAGVFSSRKVAIKLHEDIAFRVLGANNFPAHRTLRAFRQRHLEALSKLFVQVVQLAREAGLISLGRIAVDGSKVKANASKHKAMSYGRMLDEETRLEDEINELLEKAQRTDADEDVTYGADHSGTEVPEELKRREDRLTNLRAAKARLEARQQATDEAAGRSQDDDGTTRGPGGGECERPFGQPESKAQDNFTDPQSRIMKTTEGFQQSYNGQIAVDDAHQLIVAADLNADAADSRQLLPVLRQVQDNTNTAPELTLADAGYASEGNFTQLEAEGLDALVSLAREGKSGKPINPETRPATVRMQDALAQPDAKAHYRRRKAIVEPVFGWIKQAIGFRRLSLRTEVAARAEWRIVCMAINLRRMHRIGLQSV